MSITAKLEALKSFDIEKETIAILRENSDFLVFLLQYQLSQGLDGDGRPVRLFGRDRYAQRTIFEKEKYGVGLGKVTNVITNYMTGQFYQSIKTDVTDSAFGFSSEVPYIGQILARSGEKIMYLNKEHLDVLENEIVAPELQKRIKALMDGI